jgi:hypothetical protein
MTAEAEITTLISSTASATSSLASSASAQINAAIAALETRIALQRPPYSPSAQGLANPDQTQEFDPKKQVIGFPEWPLPIIAPVPQLRDIETVENDRTVELDGLTLPTFIYAALSPIERFSLNAPPIDTTVTLPPLPDMRTGPKPTRLPLVPLETPTFKTPDLKLAPINTIASDGPSFTIEFAAFNEAIMAGVQGIPGLDTLLASLRTWEQEALDSLLPHVLATLADKIRTDYEPVLAFHADLESRFRNRVTEETERVVSTLLTTAGGWDLPAAVEVALRHTAYQIMTAQAEQARSATETQSMELALAMCEFCGSLFSSLNQAAQELLKAEIDMTLKAHSAAVAYGKAAIAGLLNEFENRNFLRQDILLETAKAKLAAEEAKLRMALLQHEIADAELEIEKAKQTYDAQDLTRYQQDVDERKREVTVYAAQVSAAQQEMQLLQLPLELFETTLKAENAKLDAHEAAIRARLATIDGDEAKAKAALTQATVYEAQARGFIESVQTRKALTGAVTDRNAAIIDQYRLQVKAALIETDQDAGKAGYALDKYKVTAEDALADARIAIKVADQDLDYLTRHQDGLQRVYRIAQEQRIDMMTAELDRLKALADVHSHGAQVMAGMSTGAMQSLNGVASVVLQEF